MIFVLLIIVGGIFFSAQGAFYSLLFYLWNAYFRPDYWTYGSFIISMRLSLFIGIYLIIRTIALVPSPKINARTLLIWLFFGQTVVGCFTSEVPQTSWVFFQDFTKVLLITYLIVVLVTDRTQFRLVLLVIAMSLGFETAKQGWANLVRAPGAQNNNPIAFLGDNNGVAMGTMMLLPILGALAQTASARWERLMHRFVAFGVFMRGISTYSRGGFLGAGALAGIIIVRSERKLRAIIVVALLTALVWNIMPQTFWDRMNTITVEEGEQRDESAEGRLYFWKVAIWMADAKPMTGVGLFGFTKAYQSYNRDGVFGGDRAAHSVWFGVLGDLGYPGLLLFMANIFMAFWSCWRVGRMTRKIPELRHLKIYANALTSTLVVYCVTGSFLAQQYSEFAWHIFGLSTALHLIAVNETRALRVLPAVKRAA
jgi:probable O-glycosylation ligase (exosortase A-associated)